LARTYGTSLTSIVVRCGEQFGLIAAETMFDEIMWFHCPPMANVVAPRAQLQKLAALSGDEPAGARACTLEVRRSELVKTMEWTTTGDGRKLFVFSDPSQ